MFKKIYLEISNICNVQCSFCPVVDRDKEIMEPSEFEKIILKVRHHCEELCLHLMGEPTAHPQFEKILEIANHYKVQINLTTNGLLIKRKSDVLMRSDCIRQINFSLQSYQDNFPDKPIRGYLEPIFDFTKRFLTEKPEKYVNYRLWNLGDQNLDNEEILNIVDEDFDIMVNRNVDVSFRKSKKIWKNLYLHFDSRFEWPGLNEKNLGQQGKCYGLSQHIGIHADGTVVPCCLDKEAVIDLGNIKTMDLENILNSPLATEIRDGFKDGVLKHKLCQSCQFIRRFN